MEIVEAISTLRKASYYFQKCRQMQWFQYKYIIDR